MRQRLREASERSVLLNIIDREWESIEIPDLVSNFDVINKFLTKYEIQTKITDLVLKMEPIRTIMELSESLKNYVEEFAILIYWLEKVIETHFFDVFEKSLLISSDDDSTQQCLNEFIKSLIHLPYRVSNCKIRAKTEHDVNNIKLFLRFLEEKFTSTISRTLVLAHSKIGKSESINLTTMSQFVSKGMNISIESSKLSRFVFKWICQQTDDDVKWDRVAQRLFTDESFGSREYEMLVTDVILESESARQLQRCFGFSSGLSPILKRVLTVKMVFQRLLPPVIIRNIIDYLDVSIITSIFASAIGVWSSFEFVRSSTIEQQKHTSRLILYIVYVLKNKNIVEIWQDAFQSISEGVQNRLSKSDVELRQTGMFIGEVVSEMNLNEMKMSGRDVDEKCVLKFVYQNNEWMEEMRRIVTSGIENEQSCTDVLPIVDFIQPPTIDAQHSPNAENELDSDDDEDFPTFEVPNEEKNFEKLEKNQEPLKKHEPPKYISDAFEMLIEKEKYEVFEAALNTIESLIRRNAIGFVQISSNLISRLIFLDDLFSTPNFDNVQKKAIVACFVTRPHCVPVAVNIFLGSSCTMSHRYLILDCIRSASKELSEPVEMMKEKSLNSRSKDVAEKTWREVVEARIESNTRRFDNPSKNVKLVENRLGKLANMFFYPLLIQSTGEHLQLQGRDTSLLSKLIYTITEVYLNSGLCPSIATMSTSLIQYVTPFRFSDDPHVRISVMFAFCAVVDSLKLEHVEAIFEKSTLHDWATWASQVAGNQDGHEHERKLAECLLSQIWKKLNS